VPPTCARRRRARRPAASRSRRMRLAAPGPAVPDGVHHASAGGRGHPGVGLSGGRRVGITHGAHDSASACEADRRALIRQRSDGVNNPDAVMDRVRRGGYGSLTSCSHSAEILPRLLPRRCPFVAFSGRFRARRGRPSTRKRARNPRDLAVGGAGLEPATSAL